MSGDANGSTRVTAPPATRTRSSPCQPTATTASRGGIAAHASGTSAATGANTHPDEPAQASGSASTGIGSDTSS